MVGEDVAHIHPQSVPKSQEYDASSESFSETSRIAENNTTAFVARDESVHDVGHDSNARHSPDGSSVMGASRASSDWGVQQENTKRNAISVTLPQQPNSVETATAVNEVHIVVGQSQNTLTVRCVSAHVVLWNPLR